MDNATWSVEECEKPIKCLGFCYGHYMKNWRYGTPTPEHGSRRQDLGGMRFGSLVAVKPVESTSWSCVCDCGATTIVRTGDLNAGTTTSCGDGKIHRRHLRSDIVGYWAIHDRLRRDRGKPGTCVDCGGPASEWSYDHGDPNELVSESGSSRGFAFSLDLDHYVPRCVRCHRAHDAALRQAA